MTDEERFVLIRRTARDASASIVAHLAEIALTDAEAEALLKRLSDHLGGYSCHLRGSSHVPLQVAQSRPVP